MSATELKNLPIRVVLVEPSHPGNIGAAARAMKTMNIHRLELVAPKLFPHADATAMASGADDLLAAATVHETFNDAIADCSLVIGASARKRSLSWPVIGPREAARQLLEEASHHPVALVFGRERTGLSNEELARCHLLMNIPANSDYSSLNLAQAVQVMCYELNMSLFEVEELESADFEVDEALATAAEMDHFYTHLQQVMIDSSFLDPAQPKHPDAALTQAVQQGPAPEI